MSLTAPQAHDRPALANRHNALRVTQVDAADVARAEELQTEVQASEVELEGLRKACGKLQAKAAALQAKLDDVGGPELKAQRAKIAQMQKVRVATNLVLIH